MGLRTLIPTPTERTQVANPFMRHLAFIRIRITRITRITTALCTPGRLYFSTSATTHIAVIAVIVIFGVEMAVSGAAAVLASGAVTGIINFLNAGG